MKSKKKFDPKVFQQFFIDHTEKLVLGLVAALFLYFAYSSVTIDKYAKTPEDLKRATDAANSKIATGKGPDKETLAPDYAYLIDKSRLPIDLGKYPMPASFNWKPIAPRRLRSMPEIFAVEQLRAIPGRGAVPAMNNSRGARWIIVTGLVPYKKQLEEYRAKFDGAAWNNPVEDVPKYVGFLVQRAEVVPGSEPKWSRIMMFPPVDTRDSIDRLGNRHAVEPADLRFVNYTALTSPLPLLVDATWGNEAVCPPKIPVVVKKTSAEEGDAANADSDSPGAGRLGAGGAGLDPNRAVGGRPPETTGGAGWASVGIADASKRGTDAANPQQQVAEVPDYYLLRYLDLDVRPNKQYQYRIFLALVNPNYRLQADVLEDADSAESELIGVKPVRNNNGDIVDWPSNPKYERWSAPCLAERVSGDVRLLGGPVVAQKAPQEGSAEVRILQWLQQTGLNGSCTKDGLWRGTILNFPGAAVRSPSATGTVRADLTTNCILVDLQGGDPLPDKERHLTSPGMVLVMDDLGNLVMHDEVAEAKEWDEAKKQTSTRTEPTTRPGPVRRGSSSRSRSRPPRDLAPPDIDPVPTRQGKAPDK
jgi:hypothetical protein